MVGTDLSAFEQHASHTLHPHAGVMREGYQHGIMEVIMHTGEPLS